MLFRSDERSSMPWKQEKVESVANFFSEMRVRGTLFMRIVAQGKDFAVVCDFFYNHAE